MPSLRTQEGADHPEQLDSLLHLLDRKLDHIEVRGSEVGQVLIKGEEGSASKAGWFDLRQGLVRLESHQI